METIAALRVTGVGMLGLTLNFFSTVMKCSTALLSLRLSSCFITSKFFNTIRP